MHPSLPTRVATAMIAAVGLVIVAAPATAAPVPVANPSFEIVDGVDRDDMWNSDNHDSWIEQNTGADIRTRSVGTNQGVTGDRPNAHEDVWFTLDTRADSGLGGVYQQVGTISDLTLYTLETLVGERVSNATPGGVGSSGADVEWGLYTGAPGSFTALSTFTASNDLSATMKASNATPDSEEMALMWNSTGSGLTGQNLYIRFYTLSSHSSGTTSQILFDNVRLSAVLVPAPAALPAGLAMIGMIAARRRRK